ncbi:hypothetical protein ABLE68_22020 [Nocardioides sp. CN2-186]|uniref:hypothetical protein n=1 Tax=Nocardioides tweenelious TaxID=3156607 RepID=UPI0032B4BBA1
MASQHPAYDTETRTYNDRLDSFIAVLGAVLGVAAIIGLFMFITWFTYATN